MREQVFSASPFERQYGFCRAMRIGSRIVVAGTAPIPQDGSEPPPGAHDQMLLCGRIAVDAVVRLGGSVSDVVRTRMFIASSADSDEIGRAHREVFGETSPAATMVVVSALLDPAWNVEIEVEADITAGEAL
ncbi:MAG TPA: Rid family hydrolase [Acidimicrobiia bacterium]